MPTVEIYTWSSCPFCIRAKSLLDRKKIKFTEYCIDGDETARTQMTQRTQGKSSLPQIFINDSFIGGCDELYSIELAGDLDKLLAE